MASGPIFSGVAAAILTPIIVAAMVRGTHGVDAGRDGWHVLRPGWGVFALIGACAAFSLLCFYVYVFVGSTRADAERQMLYCLLIALAFGAGTLWVSVAALWREVSWQGGMVRVTTPSGFERLARIDRIGSIDYSHFKSVFTIRWSDGWVVEASPFMHGTHQLLEHIAERMPALFPQPDPEWDERY